MSDLKAKMHQIRFRLGLCPRPPLGPGGALFNTFTVHRATLIFLRYRKHPLTYLHLCNRIVPLFLRRSVFPVASAVGCGVRWKTKAASESGVCTQMWTGRSAGRAAVWNPFLIASSLNLVTASGRKAADVHAGPGADRVKRRRLWRWSALPH